jgi:hypothetical protein
MRASPKRRVRREVHGNLATLNSNIRTTKCASRASYPAGRFSKVGKTELNLEQKINKSLFVFFMNLGYHCLVCATWKPTIFRGARNDSSTTKEKFHGARYGREAD